MGNNVLMIGDTELKGPLGVTVQCELCSRRHKVRYGEKIMPDGTKQPSTTLAFYCCKGKSYLCGIDGRAL